MKNKPILTIAVVLVIIAAFYLIGKQLMRPNYGNPKENPYSLNLEKIGEIAPEQYGNYTATKIPLAIRKPKALAIGSDDKIYVSGDSAIYIYSPAGEKLSSFGIGKHAFALSVKPNGQILAGVKDHIEVYDTTGKLLETWESLGEKAFITSITFTEDRVYCSEPEAEMVYEFSAKGEKLRTIGNRDTTENVLRFTLPSYYFDVAIGPDGYLWAANTGQHKLVCVNKNGDVRTYWGKTSSGVEGFCGCCNPSHFAFLHNGAVITSEKGIVRVKKYNAAGEFEHAIAGPEHFTKGSLGLDIAINSQQKIHVLEPMAQVIHIFTDYVLNGTSQL